MRELFGGNKVLTGAVVVLAVGVGASIYSSLRQETHQPLVGEEGYPTSQTTPTPDQFSENPNENSQSLVPFQQSPGVTDGIIHPHAGETGYIQNQVTGSWFRLVDDPYGSPNMCVQLGPYADTYDTNGNKILDQQTEFGAVTAFGNPSEYRDSTGAINVVVYDSNGAVIASHTTDTKLDPEIAKNLKPGTIVCSNGPVTNFSN